jgi:hypothetical protein
MLRTPAVEFVSLHLVPGLASHFRAEMASWFGRRLGPDE